jgi:phosphohistidine swiveling domain-containing protein
MSMTIRGHSVSTRKDELDRGNNLATGEVGILDIDGLVAVVSEASEALEKTAGAAVVVSDDSWGPFAGVLSSVAAVVVSNMGVESLSSIMAEKSRVVDLA